LRSSERIMKLCCLLLLCTVANAATVLRMTAGGTGGTAPDGSAWVSDAPYCTGGRSFGKSDDPKMGTLPVPYRTLRWGPSFSCTIAVTPGNYKLTLMVLEPTKTAPAQRSYNATINGQTYTGMDPFTAAGGRYLPYSQAIDVAAPTGIINIIFTGVNGNALLSAIQVDEVTRPGSVCEVDFGPAGPWPDQGLWSGVYISWACQNLSSAPQPILSASCHADKGGAVLDVMLPGPTGQLQSILSAAIPCDGTAATILPGAAIPPGQFLRFAIRINEATPDIGNANQFLATVTRQ